MQAHRQIALLLALLVGCSSEAPVDTKTKISTAAPSPAAPSPDQKTEPMEAAATEVTLKAASLEEVLAAIAKHKGKVVVCDFWSTSCTPCVQEFPHLVALRQKYSADQLVCVSASLDFDGLDKLDTYRDPVLAFLNEKRATIENYLLSDEDTAVYEKLKIASIPAVYVYGVDGALKQRFDESSGKPFTYEHDINPLVEELVKAPGQ